MSVFSQELTQSIIKDFTTTKLCTYQIAQKYRLNHLLFVVSFTKKWCYPLFYKDFIKE